MKWKWRSKENVEYVKENQVLNYSASNMASEWSSLSLSFNNPKIPQTKIENNTIHAFRKDGNHSYRATASTTYLDNSSILDELDSETSSEDDRSTLYATLKAKRDMQLLELNMDQRNRSSSNMIRLSECSNVEKCLRQLDMVKTDGQQVVVPIEQLRSFRRRLGEMESIIDTQKFHLSALQKQRASEKKKTTVSQQQHSIQPIVHHRESKRKRISRFWLKSVDALKSSSRMSFKDSTSFEASTLSEVDVLNEHIRMQNEQIDQAKHLIQKLLQEREHLHLSQPMTPIG